MRLVFINRHFLVGKLFTDHLNKTGLPQRLQLSDKLGKNHQTDEWESKQDAIRRHIFEVVFLKLTVSWNKKTRGTNSSTNQQQFSFNCFYGVQVL